MQNSMSLLRKESFGGTLSNAISGKRIYISQEEFRLIQKLGILPDNMCAELKIMSNGVTISEPTMLPNNNFSAPDTIYFEITRACNLTCQHCLNNSGKQLPQELSDEQKSSIISDICSAGVQEIRLTGGEPLLVSSVSKYISQIRDHGLKVSIGTNGTLINFRIAHELVSAGLNTAIVSIDGLEKKHDSIRGAGSFRKTLTGINLLLDVGIPVRINIVAMKSNLEEISFITEYFFERNIPIMIRRFIPSGRANCMEMLSEEDYLLLKNKLHSFLSNKNGIVSGHYLNDDEVKTRINLPFKRHACSAGHRGLVILSDGSVQTCGFLSSLGEIPIGNLRFEGLTSLWQKLIESNYIDSIRSLLSDYNACACGSKTNCLAIALAGSSNNKEVR